MFHKLEQLIKARRNRPWLAAATAAGRPPGVFPPSLDNRRVLVIQWNALGDSLMTTPLLRQLRTRFPQARIDVHCKPASVAIFQAQPGLREIIGRNPRATAGALCPEVAARHYDVIIDCSADLRSACLTRAGAPAYSVGLARPVPAGWRRINTGAFYDRCVPYDEETNIIDLLLRLGEPWLGVTRDRRLSFEISPAARQAADAWLTRAGLAGLAYAVLHPGGKWAPKRWPESSWAALIPLLIERKLELVVVGHTEDKGLVERLRDGAPDHVRPLLNAEPGLLAGVIARSRGVICNDSFVMHLAGALATPTVALFGPVRPERVAGPPDDRRRALYGGLFCSPCELYFTADRCRRGLNFCLRAITPEWVAREYASLDLEMN